MGEPDFGTQTLYDQLSAEYKDAVEATPEMQGRYQPITIDEGQNFEQDWVASLLPQLSEDGRIYLLEDATQRLYPRDAGDALWTDGELLVDSVYRFKGQSAAGIVLTEVDFAAFDESVKQKLFVGLTRAHIAVEVVLTERAAGELVGGVVVAAR